MVGLYFYLVPKLPDTEALKDVRLQVPLRVYTRTGELIAEYGEMRRQPLTYPSNRDRLFVLCNRFLAPIQRLQRHSQVAVRHRVARRERKGPFMMSDGFFRPIQCQQEVPEEEVAVEERDLPLLEDHEEADG